MKPPLECAAPDLAHVLGNSGRQNPATNNIVDNVGACLQSIVVDRWGESFGGEKENG